MMNKVGSKIKDLGIQGIRSKDGEKLLLGRSIRNEYVLVLTGEI